MLGGHNEGSPLFRSADGKIEGVRLNCQCDNCLLSQMAFCLDNNCDFDGQAELSYSITHVSENEVHTFQRQMSRLEEQVEQRKAAERTRDLSEEVQIADAVVSVRNDFAAN